MDSNNRPPLSVQQQRQLYYSKQKRMQEEKLKRIRRRKRKLLLRRITVLAGFTAVAVLLVVLVMRFIDIATADTAVVSDNDGGQTPDAGDSSTVTEEADTEGLDLLSLVDPSTLNPNNSIDLKYKADEIIPTPYEYKTAPYSTFSSDNPILGSNVTTKVIIIDAGHQTETRIADVWLSPYLDPSKSSSWVKNSYMRIGTVGVDTKIPEYETTHEIALLLKTELEKLGYTVYLSHPDIDEKLNGAQRAAVANQNNADLMISLHADSYDEDKTVSGSLALVPEVWEGYPSERLSYLSTKAATVILDEYTDATGLRNRGYTLITQTSMFSFCKVPIVLLEMGFSSCPSDDKNMNDDLFREKMVSGIISGINKYFALIELAKTAETGE